MLRVLSFARRPNGAGFVSGLALALAIAGGTVAAGIPTAAHAQAQLSPSRGFSKLAQPVQKVLEEADTNEKTAPLIAQITAADSAQRAPLHAQFDAATGLNDKIQKMVAGIEKQDDRYVAGKFILDIGIKSLNPTLQRQGLMLMLDSGLTEQANLGVYNFYVGSLGYDRGDFAEARKYLRQAIDAGYTGNESLGALYLQSFTRANLNKEAVTEMVSLIDSNPTMAKAVLKEPPLRSALKVAYDSGHFYEMGRLLLALNDWYPSTEAAQYLAALPGQSATGSGSAAVAADAAKLVATVEDPRAWYMATNALLVQGRFTEREALDAMRLLARTNALLTASDYKDMLAGLAPQSLPTEAEKVLNAGIQAGLLSNSDEVVVEAKGQIAGAKGEDRAYLDDGVAIKQARGGDASRARTVGNTAFSLGEYATAEEMLKLAVNAGGTDADQLKLRLGIAQLLQGKADEAQTTLAAVSGKYAPVAKLWLAYGQKNKSSVALAN